MDKDYVVISNSLGQEISRINLPKGATQFPIELAGFATGIYNVNVYSANAVYHQKIIVNH